ncbi:hypothetical protein ACKFKF_11050 [Phormidesmis sp. 146-12]
MVQVPQGQGEAVLQIAKSCEAVNVSKTEAQSMERAIELIILHVSNRQVEDLLAQLEELPEAHITLLPTGVIALRPPASEAPQQVTNVQSRSPIEIFLSGLQSVGSWRSFLAYAAVAGIVVWIGLYTNTSYLLVAAMLIAPLVAEVYVQRDTNNPASSEQIRDRLTQTIQTRLLNQGFNVTPLVNVTVLEAP